MAKKIKEAAKSAVSTVKAAAPTVSAIAEASIEQQMSEKLDAINALVEETQECYEFGEFKVIAENKEKLENLKKDYNALAETKFFNECKVQDDPMRYACIALTYPTINIKEKTDENGKPNLSVETRPAYCDLLKLQKKTRAIGKSSDWSDKIERLGYCLALRLAKLLGIAEVDYKKIKDCYKMSDVAKQLAPYAKEGSTAATIEIIKEWTQSCVNSMIGEEFIVKNSDAVFLQQIYAKKSREQLTLACSTSKHIRQYVMEICHKLLVTDENYKLKVKLSE